jgi:hypothetical protein
MTALFVFAPTPPFIKPALEFQLPNDIYSQHNNERKDPKTRIRYGATKVAQLSTNRGAPNTG